MFIVEKELELTIHYGNKVTLHYGTDRKTRKEVVDSVKGEDEIVLSTIVNTGHRNGLEIHQLTSSGVVYIYNKKSKKLITTLIARPKQVKRYYVQLGKKAPKSILDIAHKHATENLHHFQKNVIFYR